MGLKIGYLRTPRVNHHISSSFMINRPADSIALSSLSLFQNEMNIAIWGISSHRHIQLLPAPPSTPGYWLLVSGLASAHPKDIDRPRSSITVSVPADGGFLVSVMWCSDATCFRFTLSCESQQHFRVLDVTSTKWDHTHATTTQMYVYTVYIYVYIY